jgi:predicted nucleic acid-binding protein
MLYFDTSFLVPLIVGEALSNEVDRFVKSLPAEAITVSQWTCVEFSSLLARDVRMRVLSGAEAVEAEAQFDALIRRSFAVVVPAPDDFERSRQYLQRYETGLRAGDALHLAIARNHDAKQIYTLDKGLLKAGRMLGLPVSSDLGLK